MAFKTILPLVNLISTALFVLLAQPAPAEYLHDIDHARASDPTASRHAHQRRSEPPTFCGGFPLEDYISGRRERPRLLPRSEAGRDAEFLAFQRQLLDAVARRDTAAILRVADPGIRLDFGGGDGIEFLKAILERDDSDFWEEFPRALLLGGTFRAGQFSAPYVFSVWPDEFDAFACSAITGQGVRIRKRPDLAAPIVTTLAYDIVETIQSEREIPGWAQVRTAAGASGFVASQYVRSPVDYRARFARRDGQWRLMAFVAGD